MRKLARSAVACLLLAISACAPKTIPAPVVTAPRFTDFVKPIVPPALQGSPAAQNFDRGWLFLQAGDLKNADREFALALQASPAFYPADTGGGYLELARKDPKAALPRFDRALEKQPGDTSALVGRGDALVLLAREPEAIAAFEAAFAADAGLADVRRRVDVLKFRVAQRDLDVARQAARSGRLDDAVAAFRTAIDHSPDSAFLYRELAAVARQKGDSSLALENLRHAVTLEPGDAGSLSQIGELLEAAGDLDAAARAYESANQIEPSPALDARLESLRARAAIARLPQEYRAIDAADQITRADLAALIGVRLAPLLQSTRPSGAVLITDVRNHWAEAWIQAVARGGIVEPFANHAFEPKTIVKRADFAQAVNRLLSRAAAPAQYKAWQDARPRFTDLPASHLAYPAAAVASASGVMVDGPGGAFQPNRAVTGAEAIAAIERLGRMASQSTRGAGRR